MNAQLKKLYLAFLIPAVAGLGVVYVLKWLNRLPDVPDPAAGRLARLFFILAAVMALAGPIIQRSWFAHRQRNVRAVAEQRLFRFQRNLICTVMLVPYLALAACFIQAPTFFIAGTLLMALYAIYYTYPSEKRIRYDQRLFRSKP
jgi:hypothetical protein